MKIKLPRVPFEFPTPLGDMVATYRPVSIGGGKPAFKCAVGIAYFREAHLQQQHPPVQLTDYHAELDDAAAQLLHGFRVPRDGDCNAIKKAVVDALVTHPLVTIFE